MFYNIFYLHLPVVEGLIFCILATPHLGTSFPLFHGHTPHLVPGRSVLQVAQLQERVEGGGGGGRLGHDGPAVVLIIIYAE